MDIECRLSGEKIMLNAIYSANAIWILLLNTIVNAFIVKIEFRNWAMLNIARFIVLLS